MYTAFTEPSPQRRSRGLRRETSVDPLDHPRIGVAELTSDETKVDAKSAHPGGVRASKIVWRERREELGDVLSIEIAGVDRLPDVLRVEVVKSAEPFKSDSEAGVTKVVSNVGPWAEEETSLTTLGEDQFDERMHETDDRNLVVALLRLRAADPNHTAS